MSLFAPLSDRIQSLKFPRYVRFDSPSPTRRRHRSANMAACGRCSRTSSVPTQSQQRNRGLTTTCNVRVKFDVPTDLRKKMEYTVAESDSIERIAAIHDCTVGELMKMNRLGTRMVFPGQKLIVPCPMEENEAFDLAARNQFGIGDQAAAATAGGNSAQKNEADGIRRGPGRAVQVQRHTTAKSDPSSKSAVSSKRGASRTQSEKTASAELEVDTDCLRRFIKLKVKQITETDGTVTGTLLVTPNALMFDPDVMHPLVLENGQDLYIMMARMDEVMSVAMFKDVTALTGPEGDNEELYNPDNKAASAPKDSTATAAERIVERASEDLADNVFEETDVQSPIVVAGDVNLEVKLKESQETQPIGHVASDSELPLIAEDAKLSGSDLNIPRTARRTYSDMSNTKTAIACDLKNRETKAVASFRSQQDSVQPSTSMESAEVARARSPLSRFSRTLSVHANTLRGSVTSGAERMTHTAISGTRSVAQGAISGSKSVAQGVVSQSKAAAGTLQTGIQTSAKMAASHARTAVDAVAAMPQGIVNMGSGLFSTSSQTDAAAPNQEKELPKTRRAKNLEKLLSLKAKTQQIREEAGRSKHLAHFVCATSIDEMPDLFRPVNELLSTTRTSSSEKGTITEPPYYMAVRLNRKKYGKGRTATIGDAYGGDDLIGNRARKEFWFAIPREKVDAVYHFLLQWNPEKYGTGIKEENSDKSIDEKTTCELLEDSGFVVLGSETDEGLSGEKEE